MGLFSKQQPTYHLDTRTVHRVIEAIHTREGAISGAVPEDEWKEGSYFHLSAIGWDAKVTPDDAGADAAFRAECERQGVDPRIDWT